jgi:hypothetical protein
MMGICNRRSIAIYLVTLPAVTYHDKEAYCTLPLTPHPHWEVSNQGGTLMIIDVVLDNSSHAHGFGRSTLRGYLYYTAQLALI